MLWSQPVIKRFNRILLHFNFLNKKITPKQSWKHEIKQDEETYSSGFRGDVLNIDYKNNINEDIVF